MTNGEHSRRRAKRKTCHVCATNTQRAEYKCAASYPLMGFGVPTFARSVPVAGRARNARRLRCFNCTQISDNGNWAGSGLRASWMTYGVACREKGLFWGGLVLFLRPKKAKKVYKNWPGCPGVGGRVVWLGVRRGFDGRPRGLGLTGLGTGRILRRPDPLSLLSTVHRSHAFIPRFRTRSTRLRFCACADPPRTGGGRGRRGKKYVEIANSCAKELP
jgi:hypothetical protein